MKITVLGDSSLVLSSSTDEFDFGWELRISLAPHAKAHVLSARVREEVPVRVGFDVVPNDWEANSLTSTQRAAAVWFLAESVEEARALRNAGPVQWSSEGGFHFRHALKPGFTGSDARTLRRVSAGG